MKLEGDNSAPNSVTKISPRVRTLNENPSPARAIGDHAQNRSLPPPPHSQVHLFLRFPLTPPPKPALTTCLGQMLLAFSASTVVRHGQHIPT